MKRASYTSATREKLLNEELAKTNGQLQEALKDSKLFETLLLEALKLIQNLEREKYNLDQNRVSNSKSSLEQIDALNKIINELNAEIKGYHSYPSLLLKARDQLTQKDSEPHSQAKVLTDLRN